MNTTIPTISSSVSLDITPEKKILKLKIAEKEAEYYKMLTTAEQIKREISEFQAVYEAKIGRLYTRLNELENLLFKYQNICEYVDDTFTFSEAAKVFEDTMAERRKRLEEEFNRRNKVKKSDNKKNGLQLKYKEELKRLYRDLARLFHPDKTNGNEEMMKRINKAYKNGDLQELRALDFEHTLRKGDETLHGLKDRLSVLTELIGMAKKESLALQKTDLYVLRKTTLIQSQANTETKLDTIARELTEEIERKEKKVEWYIKRYGISDEQ